MPPTRRIKHFFRLGGAALGWVGLFPALAAAATIHAGPHDYRQYLKQLQPGDTLILEGGVYQRGLPIHGLVGSAERPIIIRGGDDDLPPLFVGQRGHNTVSIIDSAYVTIAGLTLDGRSQPINAVKAEGHARWAHHITLENLVIRGYGVSQQMVGISTKCPSWNWVVRNNVIIGAGTGMYFGNSDGSDAFVGGLIEHNLVVNSRGYNLQIKHQNRREDVPGMPQGDEQTVIRHNVFSKAAGGSQEMPRPNVLVGHWPLTGPGQDDRYAIYGNFFYQNPTEALFQGEGNIGLYNNLLVNDHGDAVHIQPHNDIPRRVDVFFNTVVSAGTGIRVLQPEAEVAQLASAYIQRVVANAVFSPRPIAAEMETGNVTAPLVEIWDYLRQPLMPPGELDLRPVKALTARFDAAPLLGYPDWQRDFGGRLREPGEVGAYSAESDGDYWGPRLQRKPLLE